MMCPPPLAYGYEARVKLSTHADWRMSSSFQICWICSVTNANARRMQELGTHRDKSHQVPTLKDLRGHFSNLALEL